MMQLKSLSMTSDLMFFEVSKDSWLGMSKFASELKSAFLQSKGA